MPNENGEKIQVISTSPEAEMLVAQTERPSSLGDVTEYVEALINQVNEVEAEISGIVR
jgi:hypothetical protein